MKKLLAMSLTVLALNASAQTSWNLDQVHSKLNFTVSHMTVSDVDGSFKTIACTLTSPTDKDFNKVTVSFTADAASVNTDNEQRDTHIKSHDFFDVANNPTITFTSTSITKTKGNNYAVKGNLTLHGVTKPVSLNGVAMIAKNPMDNKKTVAGFKVTGKIKRSVFNIGKSIPNAVVGDDVNITANLGFDKK